MKSKFLFAKEFFGLFLLAVIAQFCYSQQTPAKAYLDSVFTFMLIKDGVILDSQTMQKEDNPPLWHNKKTKKQYLENDRQLREILLNTYFSPTLQTSDLVRGNLIFPGRTFGFLGGIIIHNNDLSALNSYRVPLLPVLNSQDQVSMVNPDVSNYRLNLATSSVFKNNMQINASLSNPVVSAKVVWASGQDDSKTQNISVAVGLFKNRISETFDNIKLGNISAKDFIPLYYVWNLYKDGEIVDGDQCIRSFRGICYSSVRVENYSSNIKFDGSVDAKGSFPILSLGGNVSASWTRNSTNTSNWNVYNVIMFDTPELIKFPSVKEIKQQWENITRNLITKPNLVNGKYLPYDGDLILNVSFGPLPADNIPISYVVVDRDYTINSFKNKQEMISDVSLNLSNTKPLGDSIYSIEVVLKGNKAFYESANDSSQLSLDIPLRLYLINNIGSDTLAIKYSPFQIVTENKPMPYLADNTQLISTGKKNSIYSYSTIVNIDPPTTGNFKLNLSGKDMPSILDLLDTKADLKNKFLSNCHISPAGAANNSFKLDFQIDSTAFYDYFPSTTSLNIKIQFKGENKESETYIKPLILPIALPEDVVKDHLKRPIGTLSFISNNDLISAIDTSIRVSIGPDTAKTSIGSLIKDSKTAQAKLNLIDALKKNTDLIVSPENKYLISTKYIKKPD